MAIPWQDFFVPVGAVTTPASGVAADTDEWPPSSADAVLYQFTNGQERTLVFSGFNLGSATGDRKGFIFWWAVHASNANGFRLDRIRIKAGSVLLHSADSPSFGPLGTTTVTTTSMRIFFYQIPDTVWFNNLGLTDLSVEIDMTNLNAGNNAFTVSALRLSKSPFTNAQEAVLPGSFGRRRSLCYRDVDLYPLGAVDDEELMVWPDASGRGLHALRVESTGTIANIHDDDGVYVDFPEGSNGTAFIAPFGLPVVTGNHIHHVRVMFYEGSVGATETRTIYSQPRTSFMTVTGAPGDKNILGLDDDGIGDQWVIMSGDGTAGAHLHGGTIALDTWYRATQWVQNAGNEKLWINDDASPIIDAASGSNDMAAFGIGGREDFNSLRHFEGRMSELWFIDGDGLTEADIDAARDEWVNGFTGTDSVAYADADQGATSVVNQEDVAVMLHLAIDEDPDNPTDTTWINNHGSDTGEAWFDLTDTPENFGSMSLITMELRYRVTGSFATYPGTRQLFARIYESDETTPLTDEEEVVSVTATADWTNVGPVTFSTVVASNKSEWDGARLRLRWA